MPASPFRSNQFPNKPAHLISKLFHANLVSPCSVLVLITFAVSTGLPTQLVSAWTFHQCKYSPFDTGLDDIGCASMFHANLVSPCSVLVLITFAVSTGLPTQLASTWTFHQCKDSQFDTGLDDSGFAIMNSKLFHANLFSPCSVLVLITFAVSTGLPTQLVSAWTFHQCKNSRFDTAGSCKSGFSLLSARADYFCSQHWTAHSVSVRMDISSVQILTI